MDVDFSPQPHAEAAGYLIGKAAVTRDVFDGMLPELKARAICITGIESLNTVQRVQELAAGLAEGQRWDDVKADISDQIAVLGGEADRRAEILLRTHGFQAFSAASRRVIDEDDDTTHIQYLATEDDKVRSSHLALNGIILPKTDSFWEKHTPPWEWGCRCRMRAMNPDLVDLERDLDQERNPEEKLVFEGPMAEKLRQGHLIRGTRSWNVAPNEGPWAFHSQPGDLRLSTAEVQKRYDPAVWRQFEQWAGKTKVGGNVSLLDWMNGTKLPSPPPQPQIPVVPASPAAAPAPEANKVVEKLTALGASQVILTAAQSLPPKVLEWCESAKFALRDHGGAEYRPGSKTVVINKDPSTWSGRPMSLFHEMGHHGHMITKTVTEAEIDPDFKKALEADLAAVQQWAEDKVGKEWKEKFNPNLHTAVLDEVAKVLGLDMNQLDDIKRASRFADTILGLSNGKYGAGHDVAYMQTDNHGAMEVFAHAVSALIQKDTDWQKVFAKTAGHVRKMIGL